MHTDSDSDSSQPSELDERRREIALFRYGVIADLVSSSPTTGASTIGSKKSEKDYTIPGSLRRRVAAETIRGWLRAYRRGGFDALALASAPTRAARGPSRRAP